MILDVVIVLVFLLRSGMDGDGCDSLRRRSTLTMLAGHCVSLYPVRFDGREAETETHAGCQRNLIVNL